MTTKELIAEITSGGFSQYEESGLIDYTSLRRWIRSELKRFGSNLMDLQDTILYVDNQQAKLPEGFWQLNIAVKCDPSHYEIEGREEIIQNSFFFKQRLEMDLGYDEESDSYYGMNWDNNSDSYDNRGIKFVREDLILDKAKASFFYSPTHLLGLTKGFNKKACTKECKNLQVNDSEYEINIVGDYMNTNFKKGVVYLTYYGLLRDGDGDILIPETQHNRLSEYLIYYCRMRILEDLIVGDDDANKVNLLSYYNQKQKEAFQLAMTEAKMTGLGKDWARKIRNNIRKQTIKYEAMLPWR